MGQLLGPLIGSSLLLINIYAPFYLVSSLIVAAISMAIMLPSKHPSKLACSVEPPEQERLLARAPDSLLETFPDERASNSTTLKPLTLSRSLRRAAHHIAAKFRSFLHMFLDLRLTQYAALALFTMTLGKQSLHILVQYVSKRFGISVAHAGYLLSIKAVVNLVLLVFVLPVARNTQGSTASHFNAHLVRCSIVLLVAGSAFMGLSTGLGLFVISGSLLHAFRSVIVCISPGQVSLYLPQASGSQSLCAVSLPLW